MRRAGVICEFNPFHNGHKFLLEKIKEQYADEIVCIMSGNFVQRGDIAISDKYARAEAALKNGADLVAELPTVYAVSSANIFAENGVRMAAALNCGLLCFGAENGIDELNHVVDLLDSGTVQKKIRQGMREGLYYPRALAEAVGAEYAEILEKPNNILAVEYIRACRKYGVTPVAVGRKGAHHDDEATYGDIASASKIRELILNGERYEPFTPMQLHAPVTLEKLEPVILYRLKTMPPEELSRIAGVGEGLEHRILDAAKRYNSLMEISEAVKTKRYTMARIRRIFITVLLDISAEMQNTPVPYLRILGLNSGKENLLKDAKLPLIVKTKADYDKLNDSEKELFRVDLRAAEAMNLAAGTAANEFSRGVLLL